MLSSEQSLTITPSATQGYAQPQISALTSTNKSAAYDIHPKVARFVVDTAKRYDISTQDLCALLHIQEEELEHVIEHMSWNTFATLLNHYVTHTTQKEFVDTFWDDFTREPINNNLMKIFRNLASPANIYHIMDRYVGPRMLPCLVGESTTVEGNMLVDSIRHISPEHAVPCPIYFHIVIESLRMAPSLMMGLQPAVLLDFETDGLSAKYTLRLPPSRSILRRVKDATKIFMGARSLFDLLETHQQEQHKTFEQLKTLNQELEERVSQRTHELAELNEKLAKARDQAEKESASKSRYLANLSHEIRTPLSAIIGYAELLEEDAIDQVDEQSAEDLRNITSSAKHLLALIGDILDLSKIEADKLSIITEHIAIKPLLDDIYTTFKPLAAQRQNLLKVDLKIQHDLHVHVDSMRLKQILMNLLSNAVKFTEHGKIFINAETDQTHLFICVKDTGTGMNEEELSRIFDPFEQAKRNTQRAHGGTGLGMTISKQLTELMHGELLVKSSPGVGSTFSVKLPLQHPDHTS